jgi:capsid protein
LKNGIVTHADIYAAQGKDWEEGFEQRKREIDKMRELGLPQSEANETPKEIKDAESAVDE